MPGIFFFFFSSFPFLFPRTFAGAVFRLSPDLQTFIRPESAALAQILGAGLMQAEDAVHAACLELSHQCPGAEASIAQQHIAFFQQVSHLLPEAQIMTAPLAQSMAQPAPCREAKDPEQRGHREAAALLLRGRLRPALLIDGSIRHGEAGTVEHLDPMAAPQPSGACLGGELVLQGLTGSLKKLGTQSTASLTKSRCPQGWPLGVERTLDKPGADFGDDTLTSHARVEHLEEKGPKESGGSVNGLTQRLGVGSRGEELIREKSAKKSGKIRQGEMPKMVELFGDDTGLGRLGFTLKEVRKVREKRSLNRHAAIDFELSKVLNIKKQLS